MSLYFSELRPFAIHLTPQENKTLKDLASDIFHSHGHSPLESNELLSEIELQSSKLPRRLWREIVTFRDDGNSRGAIMIKGLPLGSFPHTPKKAEDEPSWQRIPTATIIQLLIMSLVGRIISYQDEKQGRLIQDIYPKSGAENRQENSGSTLLELHTEDGFHPNFPHFISLLSIRSDKEKKAATVTSGINDVISLISSSSIEELQKPNFRIKYSSSFTGEVESSLLSPAAPVLSGDFGCFDLCVDFHGTVAQTHAAQKALNELKDVMENNLFGTILEPGEMLLVDNRRAVHGRTGFQPSYDGEDRWLRRCFSISDLRLTQGKTSGRKHHPLVLPI